MARARRLCRGADRLPDWRRLAALEIDGTWSTDPCLNARQFATAYKRALRPVDRELFLDGLRALGFSSLAERLADKRARLRLR